MANSIVKIEFPMAAKLKVGNYKLWRFNVKRHLKNHNVCDFVIKAKKPIKSEDETEAAFEVKEDAFN